MRDEILSAKALAYLAMSVATWATAKQVHGWDEVFQYALSTVFLLAFLWTEADRIRLSRRRRRAERLFNARR